MAHRLKVLPPLRAFPLNPVLHLRLQHNPVPPCQPGAAPAQPGAAQHNLVQLLCNPAQLLCNLVQRNCKSSIGQHRLFSSIRWRRDRFQSLCDARCRLIR